MPKLDVRSAIAVYGQRIMKPCILLDAPIGYKYKYTELGDAAECIKL